MGVTAQHGVVQLAQESDSFKVLLAAVLIGLPFALLAVVVQIQHGGHGIHAQTIDVILLQPVQGTGDQEALHFAAAEVEHHGAPLLVLAALGVGVLVAGLAVKIVQAELVFGEVGGHPVHDDANACGVHLIHKGHQVLGGAVAAGGCKIAGDLIAPAAVKRIFHHRQQLYMGVAHILDVRDQLVRQLGVVVGLAALLHLPAAGVHLVDIHRAVDHVRLFLRGLPCGVVPCKAGQIIDLAAVGRPGLGVEGVRIGLVDKVACAGGHAIFINIVFLHAGNEQFPHGIAINLAHGMAAGLPAVEVAYHTDGCGVRCPYTEHDAGLPDPRFQMCAEVAISLAVIALLEQVHRQIRCIALNLFFGRFHRLLLPVWKPKAASTALYSFILKCFDQFCKTFCPKNKYN